MSEEKLVEVVATKVGEYHGYRNVGDKFEVPAGMAHKSSWWKPAEDVVIEEPAPKITEPTTLSELGKQEQKETRGRNWKK